nr:hypothetical protein [Tanacetum cinerariifolium]
MQDDLLNKMRNFMQNFHNGPPGEDKETEATTDTELTSTEDIQPLPVQEPPQNSDICQLIRKKCYVEAREEQEVKNVVEQTAEREKQPENLLSMGYEHLDNHYDIFPDSKIDDDISVYDDDFE